MSIIRPPYTGDPVLDSWTNQITQYLNIGLLPGVNTPSGSDGAGANGNTTIYLYQKTASATAPAAPTSVSYDYSDLDDVTVTANNGWTGAVPGTTLKYLWVTFRYVSKLVDTITNSNTWNSPVLLASNGDPGGPGPTGPAGLNNATVLLHNKNSSSSAPSLFSGTFTYTFSTGALSGGSLNGWTQTAPSLSTGEFLFSSSAVASATTTTDTVASSEFSTPQVTGIAGDNGSPGANGDVSRTLYLYDASVNQPSAIASNAGFNASTGNAANTGTWTTIVPTIPTGQGLWIASATVTRTNNAGSFVGGGWTVYRASGYDGATGPAGPRFESRRVYLAYTPTNANGTDVPATPTAVLTWSTGNVVVTPSTWNEVPPTKVVNSAVNIYFSDFLFIDIPGTATTSSDTGTTAKQGTSFSGVVSFVGDDFTLDGSTVTNIDGGNITTNSIKTDQIDVDDHVLLSGNNSGILGGRSSISSYKESGFYVGRELRPTVMTLGGLTIGREFIIVSVGTTNFIPMGASSNAVGVRFVFNGVQIPNAGNGTIQKLGFEVSHTTVNGLNQLEGIIHDETEGLRIFNPELISGGNVITGVDTKTTTGTTFIGVGSSLGVISLSAIGGGGGGGYGVNNGTGSGGRGGTGGNTVIRLRQGSASGSIIANTTLTATGAIGGLNAPTDNQQGGLAGAFSEFGVGGAYVGQNAAANSAPSTSYGAGGGGAGGDSQGFFGDDGAGGSGGSAAVKQTLTYNAASNGNNLFIEVVSIGAGGAGGSGGTSNRNGGAGAGGVVQHTAVMGSTVSKEVVNLATNQYNTIGSYCLAMVDPASSIQLTVGTQIAGSNLKPAAFGSAGNGSSSGLYVSRQVTSLSGTWKSIGGSTFTNSFFTTLWVRIS